MVGLEGKDFAYCGLLVVRLRRAQRGLVAQGGTGPKRDSRSRAVVLDSVMDDERLA